MIRTSSITLFFGWIFSILTFLPLSTSATTITWVGGTGTWFDKGHWDTGTIPTINDEVIINSGSVFIDNGNAAAQTLTLDASADLTVFQGRILEVETVQFSNGLTNYGYIINMGTIQISSPSGSNNTGFLNYGTFYNRGGVVEISQVGLGYRNYTAASTTNDGIIEIHDLYGVGGGCLSNMSEFTNEKGATIELYNLGLTSYIISNFTTPANFYNHGEIDIHDCLSMTGEGIQITEGVFRNEIDGVIRVIETGNTGFFVGTNGTFRNSGQLQIHYTGNLGILANGFMVNHQSGFIFSSNTASHVIMVGNYGEIRNFGQLYTSAAGFRSLLNQGIFNNYPKGKFLIENSIFSNGYFNNMGNMTTYFTGTNVIINPLNNNGIVGDHNDSFTASDFNNNGVIVKPIYGNVEVGVPVSNALSLGSLSNVTVVSWTIGQSSNVSAGTYNSSTNTFTPNSNAAGLTEIYVALRRTNSGLTKKYVVPVPNGIQNPSPRLGLTSNGLEGTLESQAIMGTGEEFKVYPNPTNNHFQIINGKEYINHLEIVDQMGRIILTEKAVNQESLIQLPAGTTPGIYTVRVQNKEGKTTSKPIIVQ